MEYDEADDEGGSERYPVKRKSNNETKWIKMDEIKLNTNKYGLEEREACDKKRGGDGTEPRFGILMDTGEEKDGRPSGGNSCFMQITVFCTCRC